MKPFLLTLLCASAMLAQRSTDLIIIDARPEGSRWAMDLPSKYIKTFFIEPSSAPKYFAVSYGICGSAQQPQRYTKLAPTTTRKDGQNVATLRIVPPLGAEICNVSFEALNATPVKEIQ